MWGVFLMTRLPASSSSRGGWQATCPYHRKSQVTACRKACMAIDTSQEASHRVLRQLKFWCLQAPTFDRQRAHMLLDPRLETALPPDEVLDAQVPTVAPQGVLLDEQLDAQGSAPPLTDASGCAGVLAGARGRARRAPATAPTRQQAASSSAGPAAALPSGRGRGRPRQTEVPRKAKRRKVASSESCSSSSSSSSSDSDSSSTSD